MKQLMNPSLFPLLSLHPIITLNTSYVKPDQYVCGHGLESYEDLRLYLYPILVTYLFLSWRWKSWEWWRWWWFWRSSRWWDVPWWCWCPGAYWANGYEEKTQSLLLVICKLKNLRPKMFNKTAAMIGGEHTESALGHYLDSHPCVAA